MKEIITLTAALAFAGCFSSGVEAAEPAASSNAHGLSVGAQAPAFKLKETDGKEHSLADFTKTGKFVALV